MANLLDLVIYARLHVPSRQINHLLAASVTYIQALSEHPTPTHGPSKYP